MKRFHLHLESGRTLTEIVAVFFIMGVITIAVLFTYLYLLERYQFNKTIDQIETLEKNIKELYIGKGYFSSYEGLSMQMLISLGLVPKDLEIREDRLIGYNVWGGVVDVDDAGGNDEYFTLSYYDLPGSVCSKLSLRRWTKDLVYLEVNSYPFRAPFPPETKIIATICNQEKNKIMFQFK